MARGREASSAQAALASQAIRSQVDRILVNEIFSRSERLSRFLKYVVEETLAGRGAELKEPVLAAELYGKKVDSESGDDSTVRVDARRLRDKLREYYGEYGARDSVLITLPKGRYTPSFERNPLAPASVPMAAPQTIRQQTVAPQSDRIRRSMPFAVAFVAMGIFVVSVLRREPVRDLWNPIPISLLPGQEGSPTLSPDGNLVAFTWSGSKKPGQTDIYVKTVGGADLNRLTNTAASEVTPAWSPDGNYFAFVRLGQGVFIMSQLGGAERRISPSGRNPAWTPDSRSVLIRDQVGERPAGIFEISLETLERRQITQAERGAGDWKFAVSPDGKTLAFDRSVRLGVGDIYTVPMSGGEPQRRTNWNAAIGGVLWTQDGRELIYNVGYGWPLAVWRVRAHGSRPERGRPVVLPTGIGASFPSISKPVFGRPARLVFETGGADISLRLIDLEASRLGELIQGVQPLCDSSIVDYPGAFSPDATRVVFTSARTGRAPPGGLAGTPQLWITNRDNTGLRQLTDLDSPEVRHPAWSPDGQRIAFEATLAGNTDIYLISPEGGALQRLTSGDAIDKFPAWSGDGRWIYFSSDRSGRDQIWKLATAGGTPVQITRNGGVEPIESLDGKFLYYVDVPPGQPSTLKQVLVEGGEETVVRERVPVSHWAVTEKGIFFLRSEPEFDAIDLLQRADRTVKLIGRLPFRVAKIGDIGRFTVSRNGRWALTHEMEGILDGGLMMIDGFR